MIRLPSDLLWHKFPPSANHSPHPPSQSKVIQCQDWLSFVFMTSLFLDYKAMTLFPLRFDPCASCKLPLVAPYLWIKSGMHAFLKNGNDLFLTQVSVCITIRLKWQLHALTNWSVILSRQLTEDLTQKNWIFEWSYRPSQIVSVVLYLKTKDYRTDNKMHMHKTDNKLRMHKTDNKMHMDTIYKWQKMAAASISTSISLPSTTAGERWVSRLSPVCLQKMVLHATFHFQWIQTSSEQWIHSFPFLHITALSFVLSTHVHHLSCLSYKYNTVKVTP